MSDDNLKETIVRLIKTGEAFRIELERELHAANKRIKRLEEIGDEMRAWCNDKKSCEQWDKSRRPNHEVHD